MTVDSLADEIRRLHDLCEARRIENESPRPRWMRWFNAAWSSTIIAVVLVALILLSKLQSNVAGVFVLVLLLLSALGLIHMMISIGIDLTFMVKDLREDKKPFSRLESERLPDLIREEIHMSRIDPGVVDHVIASQELNAAVLQSNLNWMKGSVLGAATGIVALVYQGSALRLMLEQWLNSSTILFAQATLLVCFLLLFVVYVALWRRIVRSENRARFLKYIRDRRLFLLALESEAES